VQSLKIYEENFELMEILGTEIESDAVERSMQDSFTLALKSFSQVMQCEKRGEENFSLAMSTSLLSTTNKKLFAA
jgi:hypothetical protein